MKTLTIITAACCLGTFGCRLTDAPFQPESLTARYQRPESSAPSGAELSRLPPPTQQVVPASHVYPVAYQPEPESLPMDPQSIEPVQALPSGETGAGGMSLLDFEDMALQNNPALGQMANLIDASQGNWLQVGLLPNTRIGYSGQQLGSRGLAEQQGIFLGQKFITGKKLQLNREVAGWQVERAEQEFEVIRYRVLTDVRISYYDALIAQRRRDLSEELADISDKAVAAAQALFQGEEVSEADPLRARVEADSARILLQNATNQQQEAWRRLAATVGLPDLMLTRVEGNLNPEGLDISWDDTLQQILSDSPEMASAMAKVESTQWAIDRAYAEVVPDIDVQGVMQDDRSTGTTNGALQVTLPIPFLNRNQGGIQQARAEAIAAELAVDRLALDLQSRLAGVFQRYESARNQVHQYSRESGILENADRTLELIRAGYQAEEFSLLDMLTAQRTYFRTNLAYLDSLRALWAADMEIQGQLLTGSLAK